MSSGVFTSPRPGGGTSSIAAVAMRVASAEAPAEGLLRDALAAQCAACGADAAAVVVLAAAGDRSTVLVRASHPASADPTWLRVAGYALAQQNPSQDGATRAPMLLNVAGGTGAGRFLIAMPAAGPAEWAVYLIATRDPEIAEACRRRLELAAPLLTLVHVQQTHGERVRRARLLSEAVQVLSAVGRQPRFRGAAMALCNEVAARWGAARVTLGVLRGRYVRAVATSHSDAVDRKTAVMQAVEAAMEECLDQNDTVQWSDTAAPRASTTIDAAARRLAAAGGNRHIVSMPLPSPEQPDASDAVLTVEHDGDAPAPAPDAIEAMEMTCRLVAPLLLTRRENDRWLGAKVAADLRRLAAAAVGPEHTWAKAAALAVMLGLLSVCLIRAPHRVSAPFLVQAQTRHIVAAPFDGYLKQVYVEPGDEVDAAADATPLAELETAELRLELVRTLAEQNHFAKQADLARREEETARMQIAQAEAERVAADAALLRRQIERAVLRAPVSGVVVEGDRKRRIGGAVSKGEPLFEVASLEGLRAELRVPEDRIAAVEPGQRGELAAASHPDVYLPFVVDKIEPMAEVIDGRNVFRVWVRLESSPRWLRPGMEGVAKIDVGHATLAWLWTHEAVEWLRMTLWF